MEIALPILFLLIPVFWAIGNYNALVRLRNHCGESWADIDTELKRRHDLIPNLVESVKGFARHEEALFRTVTEARARAMAPHDSRKDVMADENRLVGQIGQLFAVAEGYPDLKSDRHFLELQRELVNTEDRIQSSRRFFNSNVRELNNRVEMFPSSIIANAGGFEKQDYFEIDSLGERSAPQVSV
ncbi:MAG: LemA family protein [Verrucomicrobiota bacterium]